MTMDIPATMKAVVFEKIGQWAVRQVPTPRLTGPTDLLWPAASAARTTRSCSTRPARTPRPA